jgi:hypothetical protein
MSIHDPVVVDAGGHQLGQDLRDCPGRFDEVILGRLEQAVAEVAENLRISCQVAAFALDQVLPAGHHLKGSG